MPSSLPGKAAEIRALLLTLIDTVPQGAALRMTPTVRATAKGL